MHFRRLPRLQGLDPGVNLGREHWSPAARTNTRDGARMAEAVGGRFDASLKSAAAWTPVSRVPRKDGSEGIFTHFIDCAELGVIAVDLGARRLTNEAHSDHDFVKALGEASQGKAERA